MKQRKVPLRKCTGCQEMKNKKDMMRILKTTENEIVLDTTGKKNGRGAYICPSMACLNAAIKNRGIERSLNVSIPKEVIDLLTEEMKTIGK